MEDKTPLASEMYEDLKKHVSFLHKLIIGLEDYVVALEALRDMDARHGIRALQP